MFSSLFRKSQMIEDTKRTISEFSKTAPELQKAIARKYVEKVASFTKAIESLSEDRAVALAASISIKRKRNASGQLKKS